QIQSRGAGPAPLSVPPHGDTIASPPASPAKNSERAACLDAFAAGSLVSSNPAATSAGTPSHSRAATVNEPSCVGPRYEPALGSMFRAGGRVFGGAERCRRISSSSLDWLSPGVTCPLSWDGGLLCPVARSGRKVAITVHTPPS